LIYGDMDYTLCIWHSFRVCLRTSVKRCNT